MRRSTLALSAAALALAACTDAAPPTGPDGSAALLRDPDAAGAVYTLSNAANGNELLVFARAADGSLSPAGAVPTGGLGTGAGLGSQGAVVASDDGRLLFAVDAGSDEISVFALRPQGPALVDRVASGGDRPISLTVHHRLLYVLNAGSETITGFTVGSDGSLSPLAGSTRPLSGAGVGPAQVEFSPDGRLLVVTEKATSLIDTYTVGRDGLASGPLVQASEGTTPFGFAFDRRGRLFVSEAFGGAPDASALSSYDLDRGGVLETISPSVGTTETAACWVVVTHDGRFAYTTNTGSGTVTGYAIADDGSVSLLDADGATGTAGTGPIDAAFDASGRHLYVLNAGGTISAFSRGGDGSLTPLSGASGLPAGTVGIAAR